MPPDDVNDNDVHISFAALARFARSLLLWGALIAVPAALVAYLISARSEPNFRSEASVVAPKRALDIDLVTDEPEEAAPLPAAVYVAALRSSEVLAGTWHRLRSGGWTDRDPNSADLEELSTWLRLEYEDRRLSLLLHVSAEASDPRFARELASAAAASLIAWDDDRAKRNAELWVGSLETQQRALQGQLEQLIALGDRVALSQTTWVSQLLTENRQELALARSQAVGVRGALDLVQEAGSAVQLSPNPVYDAVVVLLLAGMAVTLTLMVRNAVRTGFTGPEGLAEASGLPLLATFTSPPNLGAAPTVKSSAPWWRGRGARSRGTVAHGAMALPFLKAHVDRALPRGGRLLVVGIGPQDGARSIAAALAVQYRARAGSGDRVQVSTGPALLAAASALEVAASADATVLVADPATTSGKDLNRALDWLRLAEARVLGIVASPSRDPVSGVVGLRGGT